MTEIPARLTAALADCSRIERELGQRGMATALKPELAAELGARTGN